MCIFLRSNTIINVQVSKIFYQQSDITLKTLYNFVYLNDDNIDSLKWFITQKCKVNIGTNANLKLTIYSGIRTIYSTS